VEDRTLRCLLDRLPMVARKAAAEDDSGGFGKRPHVLAEEETNQFEHRGLAGARSPGQHDPPPRVAFEAVARFHIVSCASLSNSAVLESAEFPP
jgi:hypothetical protein